LQRLVWEKRRQIQAADDLRNAATRLGEFLGVPYEWSLCWTRADLDWLDKHLGLTVEPA
jgi:hypothetical protein